MSVHIGGSNFKRQHYKIQWFVHKILQNDKGLKINALLPKWGAIY
jgi:hypothetical protein